ncbi:hypothetical protein ONZ45_g10703 [Pleurotus djamor]|nr:hypothetical protein ONZ45_g10703 [Pleurotus djamor]
MPLPPLWLVLRTKPKWDGSDASLRARSPLKEAFQYFNDLSPLRQESEYDQWKTTLQQTLCTSPKWIEVIERWLWSATNGLELPKERLVNLFIDVMWFRSIGQSTEAWSCIVANYMEAKDLPVPSKYSFTASHEEPEIDEIDDIVDDDEYNWEGIDLGDLSEMNVVSAEEFASLVWSPKHAKQWVAMVLNNPDGYEGHLQLCKRWTELLCAFFDYNTDASSETRQKALASKREWRDAVKASGLAAEILRITSPDRLLEIDFPHIIESYRLNLWRESLSHIVWSWTPSELRRKVANVIPTAYSGADLKPCTAESILKFISENPAVIPTPSYPCSVFMFTNAITFIQGWERWLCPALSRNKFQVTDLPEKTLRNHYRVIISYARNLDAFEKKQKIELHERLRTILVKSIELRDFINQVKDESFRKPDSDPPTYDIPSFLPKRPEPGIQKTTRPTPGIRKGITASSSTIPTQSHAKSKPPKVTPPGLSRRCRHLEKNALKDRMIGDKGKKKEMPAQKAQKRPLTEEEIRTIEEDGLPLPPDGIHNSCTVCAQRPPELQCIRPYYVTPRDISKFDGQVLTCADAHDRLSPDSKNDLPFDYYSPTDAQLKLIKHRPEVYRDCGQDKVLFIHGSLIVGAVQFKAFSDSVLERLQDHHKTCSDLRTVKRGGRFKAFALGASDMKALGSRLPQGGNAGSFYGAYHDVKANEDKDIDALFAHAQVSNALIVAGRSIMPSSTKYVADIDQDFDPLGAYGFNLFVCHNYLAPLHRDKDDLGISVCFQLKKRCREDEFNFAFMEWGVYVQTEPNTLWLFYGAHCHGTIMPRSSSYNALRSYRKVAKSPHDGYIRRSLRNRADPPPPPPNGNQNQGPAAVAQNNDLEIIPEQPGPDVELPDFIPPAGGLVFIEVLPGDASTGYHGTNNRRNRRHAKIAASVRGSYASISQYWLDP